MISIYEIIRVITLCYVMINVRSAEAAGVKDLGGGVRETTSKALFFRTVNNKDESDVLKVMHRERRNTFIDVITQDGFVKTMPISSSSFSKEARKRSTGSGDDTSRTRSKRSTDFTSSNANAIVAKHNEGRSMVSPEAADMKTMKWNDALATMAQQWSDGCHYEHGNPENISPFSAVGQNLYIKWGLDEAGIPPDGTAATEAWYNEFEFYDYQSLSCQPGQQCGHYTQNVWASTYAVGCGLTFCTTATDDVGNTYNGAWLITCNYGPAGNYVGQRPYTKGSSCTKCESGRGLCSNKLCNDCSPSVNSECECKAECNKCGTLNNDCSCTCADGWYGTDCTMECVDTHHYCNANPGWPASWCDRSYVIDGCPLMCGTCNVADPSFVCDSNLQDQNGVLILLNEKISEWDSIKASVLSSIRTTVATFCGNQQSTCCPSVNSTVVNFSNVGLTLGEGYPTGATEYASPAYWIQVIGISPVAPGICSIGDGGMLSSDAVLTAINQDLNRLESSLGVDFGDFKRSTATRVILSLHALILTFAVILQIR